MSLAYDHWLLVYGYWVRVIVVVVRVYFVAGVAGLVLVRPASVCVELSTEVEAQAMEVVDDEHLRVVHTVLLACIAVVQVEVVWVSYPLLGT
jgi:uncharacterized membrane protein